MPTLRVTSNGRALKRRDVRKLNKFVNHLLLLRDRGAPVHQFEVQVQLELGVRHREDPQASLWIRHALLCQVRKLTVHVTYGGYMFVLDDLYLISRHLVRLEFCDVVLGQRFLNFSGCPALELQMASCAIASGMISSLSLKQLTIIDGCTFCPNVQAQISTPNLITLELAEFEGKTPLLNSMPSLVAAFVKLTNNDEHCDKEHGGSCIKTDCGNCGADGDGTTDCVLLKGLSVAESLKLTAEPGMFMFKRDLMWCPTFSKLKNLSLNEWCVALDLHGLVCFLQHTPVLERLSLQLCKAHDNWKEKKRKCNLTEQSFASKHLKVVEVKYEKFDKRVHNILMLLSNDIYIEQINIQRSTISSEGAGSSGAQAQRVSPSEKAPMKNMIDYIVGQQQQILDRQQNFLAAQQALLTQEQQQEYLVLLHQQWFLGGTQRRWQILDQILTQLSNYSASSS